MTSDAIQTLPLLTVLLAVPALGAVLALLVRGPAALGIARLAAALTVGLSVLVVAGFQPERAGPQLVVDAVWLPSVGARWHLGVDGLSLPFLPLTALLMSVVLGTIHPRRVPSPGLQAALVLWLGTALLGVYVALDAVVFFGFWELGLAPIALLLVGWGTGASPQHTALRGFVSLLLGGVPLLLGLLVLAGAGPMWTTDLGVLASQRPPMATQALALVLLGIGLAAKAPLPPLHGWMPEALGEGPAALGAMVVGLKIGVWALVRLVLPTCPDAVALAAPWLTGVAVVGSVYAGLHALRQPTLRRLIAWVGISHVGIAVLGITSLDGDGVRGGVMALVSFALSAAPAMLVAGLVMDRLDSEDLHGVGGLATVAPRLAGLMVAAGLAMVGLPGTSGFVGELLAVTGGFRAHPWTLLFALPALGLGAVATVRAGERVLGGPPSNQAVAELRDVSGSEAAPVLLLLALSVIVGLFPGLVLHRVGASADALVSMVHPSSPTALVAGVPLLGPREIAAPP